MSGYKFTCDVCGNYQPIETKTIICIDCGKDIEVDARNMTKVRCDECQHEYRKNYQKNLMRKRRNNDNI